MKSLYRYYSRFRKHRQDEIKRIVRSEIIQQTIQHKSLINIESLLNDMPRSEKIVVSLTSFGQRIHSVYLAIESLAQQTIKPDEAVLWLSQDDFVEDELPVTIQRLMNRGLKVRFCKDVGPHTKLLYALKEYPNDIIISIDDDIVYPIDLIERLYDSHIQNPENVCCNVGRRITIGSKGKVIPYREWKHVCAESETSLDILPLGVNGVLYPSHSFDSEVYNLKAITELCSKADDIWFRMMSFKNKILVSVTGAYPNFESHFTALDSSFMDDLAQDNVIKGLNDIQLKAVMERYGIDL